jgi:hypothetical protein
LKIKHLIRNLCLSVADRAMPSSLLRQAGNLVRQLELNAWMRSRGFFLQNVVERREELFQLVASEVGTQPVLYLEFGVYKGDATRLWSELLQHPDTLLHGFDSFEGLPEEWTPGRPKGTFSTHGEIPCISDQRVTFFRGWFEHTLLSYEPPPRPVVVLNLDADLYSSTIFVLRKLRALMRPGTYLYFDEFSSLGHEERAFREFVEESGMRFKLRGATRNLLHVLYQCVD